MSRSTVQVLIYVVDCALSLDPLSDFLSLQREVEAYSRQMALKPNAVVATKCDLEVEQTLKRVDAWPKRQTAPEELRISCTALCAVWRKV